MKKIECLADYYDYYEEEWKKAGKPKEVKTPEQLKKSNHKKFGHLIGTGNDYHAIDIELQKLGVV